jgi:hypothetical protein
MLLLLLLLLLLLADDMSLAPALHRSEHSGTDIATIEAATLKDWAASSCVSFVWCILRIFF